MIYEEVATQKGTTHLLRESIVKKGASFKNKTGYIPELPIWKTKNRKKRTKGI